jgi:hypothetical protein
VPAHKGCMYYIHPILEFCLLTCAMRVEFALTLAIYDDVIVATTAPALNIATDEANFLAKSFMFIVIYTVCLEH